MMTTMTTATTITVPAHGDYLAMVRAVVAGVAAHADLDRQAQERARTAAHEAARLLLTAGPTSDLHCRITEAPEQVQVTISADMDALEPDTSGLGWIMLISVAPDAVADHEAGVGSVRFTLTP